ncbi:MAG: RING finger domain-containing protein [Promethearchaeota archaeon]
MKCLICHKDINELNIEERVDCPNHHSVHTDCLKEWFSHSKSCPLCSEPYSQLIINKYKSYFQQKEKEEQEFLEKEKKEQEIITIKKIAEKIEFKKYIEIIEKNFTENKIGEALDKIEALTSKFGNNQKFDIMFLKGKANYLRGRYDMAINFLFKLVKEQFDFPEAFLYLGKSYEALGLEDKAKWAYDRVK